MNKIIEDLKANEENLVKIILSDSKTEVKKILVRPIMLKGKQVYQIERFIGNQVFHANVGFDEVKTLDFENFKQITIEKVGETSVYAKAKTTYKVKKIEKESADVKTSP